MRAARRTGQNRKKNILRGNRDTATETFSSGQLRKAQDIVAAPDAPEKRIKYVGKRTFYVGKRTFYVGKRTFYVGAETLKPL